MPNAANNASPHVALGGLPSAGNSSSENSTSEFYCSDWD